MPTLLCVPILVQDAGPALADAAAAGEAGADLVEFRIDQAFHGEGDTEGEGLALRLCRESPLPCIVTCRPVSEGGFYDGDEAARLSLFERLGTGDHPPRYIDVELAAYTRSANARMKVDLAVGHPSPRRDLHTSLILSTHDFAGRPADLDRRVLAMRQEAAPRVLKVAFTARSLRDNLELFEILGAGERPAIALAMGEMGLMSRVLAPKFGGFLTFASLRRQSATAPGQPTLDELLNLYRFRQVGPETRVYGVVGWPLGHSLSPLVHNAAFAGAGIDAVYLPLPIAGDGGEGGFASLKATLGELVDHPRLGFCGCSVTIPHKESLLRLALERGWEVEALASEVGAANTLVVERDRAGAVKRVRVLNTDAPAAAEWIETMLGDLSGARIAVLGAGGAGMAVAFAAAAHGAAVMIVNRTRGRAEALAQRIRTARLGASAEVAEPSALGAWAPRAVVNCTPVGMAGHALPIPAGVVRGLGPGTVFFDTIYNPLQTPLLRAAADGGCPTRNGLGMFIAQAALQFRAWTGAEFPRGSAEELVRGRLAGA